MRHGNIMHVCAVAVNVAVWSQDSFDASGLLLTLNIYLGPEALYSTLDGSGLDRPDMVCKVVRSQQSLVNMRFVPLR